MPLTADRKLQWIAGLASLAGVVLAFALGAPHWVAVIFAGVLAYVLALAFVSHPAVKIAVVSAVAAGTVAGLFLIHSSSSRSQESADSKQSTPKPSGSAEQARTAATLQVSALKSGNAIPRCNRISGTGLIPAGQEVWVGHRNTQLDDEGKLQPRGPLMNLRQAENLPDQPNVWQVKDDYWIGDDKDNRTFRIYVYEVPVVAGDVIKQWLYPDGFANKYPNWQPTLTGALDDIKPIKMIDVTRTSSHGCKS